MLFESGEQIRVQDKAVLDGLRPARRQLPCRQRVQKVDIRQNEPGLVEGSDQVLAFGEVDGRLPSQARVNHRGQGGGHLHERHPAQPCCRTETREVADHAAAEGHDAVDPLGPEAGQPCVDPAHYVDVLRTLARRQCQNVGGKPGLFENLLHPARPRREQSLVGDDEGAAAKTCLAHLRAQTVQQPAAGQHSVIASQCPDNRGQSVVSGRQ